MVTAASPAAATLAVTLGERVGWGNVPTWVEGQGFVTRDGSFRGDFVARDSYGVAYALCAEGGRLLARFDAPDPGFHEGPSTGEAPQRVPLDAPSASRVIALVHAAGSLGKAAAELPCRAHAPARQVLLPDGLPANAHLEVARCGTGGHGPAPYARFLPGEGDLVLPEGCFQVRLTAPGHPASAWASSGVAGIALPPAGLLRFDVNDHIGKVEDAMRDWYALLDAGFHVTATGNSDSHKLTFHEPGVPRNFVAVPNDDPAAFDERAFVAAVRKGRVVVSSGPFLRLEANGKGVGDTIPAGDAAISILVDAPPWVDVTRVELVRRGEVVGAWSAPFPRGPHRAEVHVTQPLRRGDWILAVARGDRPMTYLHRPGARPFAFTNPIWVE